MSFVSSVSHELMDRVEMERNAISLAAVSALGEAHLKCCMQMYDALALDNERLCTNPCSDPWRKPTARHSKSTVCPGAEDHDACENPGCDHTEGFESGLRSWGAGRRRVGTCFWNCVGRCSQVHSDDEYGPDFFSKQSAVGYICQQHSSLRSPVAVVLFLSKLLERIRPRHLGNGMSADGDRMQVDSLKERLEKGQR